MVPHDSVCILPVVLLDRSGGRAGPDDTRRRAGGGQRGESPRGRRGRAHTRRLLLQLRRSRVDRDRRGGIGPAAQPTSAPVSLQQLPFVGEGVGEGVKL